MVIKRNLITKPVKLSQHKTKLRSTTDLQDAKPGGPRPFIQWLRERRQTLDMTQSELAASVFTSISTIQKIEEGARRPSKQLAATLAVVLLIPDEQRTAFLTLARATPIAPTPPGKEHPTRLPTHSRARQLVTDLPSTPADPAFEAIAFGRELEIAQLLALLDQPEIQLITIKGMAGVGKTALCQAVMTHPARQKTTPVIQVDLSAVACAVDEPAACERVARALLGASGATTDDHATAVNQAITRFRNDRSVVIFEHIDHLLPARAFVAQLVQAAPHVKIIVTSRERLRLGREHVFELAGLEVDGKTRDSFSTAEQTPGTAVRLLLHRLGRVNPEALHEANTFDHATELCRLVDGWPFAIIAAADYCLGRSLRVATHELHQNLALLDAAAPALGVARTSVTAMLESTWAGLTDSERTLVCQLSVFVDGFSHVAVVAVIAPTMVDAPSINEIRDVLSRLMDKSVVQRGDNGRMRMGEPLRRFAAARAGSPAIWAPGSAVLEELRARYSAHYMGLLTINEAEQLTTPMLELKHEFHNLCTAWLWQIEQGKFLPANLNANGLLLYFVEFDQLERGAPIFGVAAERMKRALAAAQSAGSADLTDLDISIGFALSQHALAGLLLGRHHEALALATEALTHTGVLAVIRVYASILMASALCHIGVDPRARALLDATKPLYEQAVDEVTWLRHARIFQAMYLMVSAHTLFREGRLAVSIETYERALHFMDGIGKVPGIWQGHTAMCAALRASGDLNRAESTLFAAESEVRRTGSRRGAWDVTTQRAELAFARGYFIEALHLATRALAISERGGTPAEQAASHALLDRYRTHSRLPSTSARAAGQ